MSNQSSSNPSYFDFSSHRSDTKKYASSVLAGITCLSPFKINTSRDNTLTPISQLDQQEISGLKFSTENTQTAILENDTECIVTDKQKKLNQLLRDDIPEDGVSGQSEVYIRSLLRENPLETRHLLQILGFICFSDENTNVFINLLNALSHLKQSDIFPEGQFIALGALLHEDDEVKEYGVKCFENWRSKENIPLLSRIETSHQWLQDYIADVISDLRSF